MEAYEYGAPSTPGWPDEQDCVCLPYELARLIQSSNTQAVVHVCPVLRAHPELGGSDAIGLLESNGTEVEGFLAAELRQCQPSVDRDIFAQLKGTLRDEHSVCVAGGTPLFGPGSSGTYGHLAVVRSDEHEHKNCGGDAAGSDLGLHFGLLEQDRDNAEMLPAGSMARCATL